MTLKKQILEYMDVKDIPLSRKEIADGVCCDEYTVRLAISHLKNMGVIIYDPSEDNFLLVRADKEYTEGTDLDAGQHYRFEYKGIKLDPFRIAKIFELDAPQLTILKKTLVNGNRGNKDAVQDYKDIICAAQRAIEIIEEDI